METLSSLSEAYTRMIHQIKTLKCPYQNAPFGIKNFNSVPVYLQNQIIHCLYWKFLATGVKIASNFPATHLKNKIKKKLPFKLLKLHLKKCQIRDKKSGKKYSLVFTNFCIVAKPFPNPFRYNRLCQKTLVSLLALSISCNLLGCHVAGAEFWPDLNVSSVTL